jgi:hypothetical protein
MIPPGVISLQALIILLLSRSQTIPSSSQSFGIGAGVGPLLGLGPSFGEGPLLGDGPLLGVGPSLGLGPLDGVGPGDGTGFITHF